jgi:hypothetical protein
MGEVLSLPGRGAVRDHAWRLTFFLTATAVIAGFLQAPLSVVTQNRATLYLDDLSVIAAFCSVLVGGLLVLPGLPAILAGLWLLVLAAAFLETTAISQVDGLNFMRQVSYPAVLILVGMRLGGAGLRRISRLAIGIGLINSFYAPFELFGHKIVDPTRLLSTSTDNISYLIRGLPGYYWIQLGGLGSRVVERAGGLVLNPPICGLVTGFAFAAAWHDREIRWRRGVLACTGLATCLTFSRGGILVALAGAFLPGIVRWLGRSAGLVCFGLGGIIVGGYVAGQGGSAAHSNGLLVGLLDALHYPMGRGYGFTGDLAKILGTSSTGESLAGIAFSAGGITEVALVGILFVALWRRLHGEFGEYAAIGVATVVAASVSETAGALNGTIPMWLSIGVALTGRLGQPRRGVTATRHQPLLSGRRR